MPRAQYYVVFHQRQWRINLEGQHYGPYYTQADAIRAAVDAAHESGWNGHDAQVFVQGRDNRFRVEWTYGHDPYPPPG